MGKGQRKDSSGTHPEASQGGSQRSAAKRGCSAKRGKKSRWAIAIGLVLALLVGAEFGVASWAEKGIESAIARNPHIDVKPQVSIGSFPLVVEIPQGHVGGLLVNLNDEGDIAAQIPHANVQVEYSDVQFDRTALMGHRLRDFRFSEGTGRIYISSGALALGSGIADLQFQAADNASPAGIGEDHALLSGTVRLRCPSSHGEYAKVAVKVRSHVFFWLEAKRVELDSEDLVSFKDVTPKRSALERCSLTDETRQAAMKAMELSLWVPHLPLGIEPKLAFAQSGNLVIVGPTPQSPITGKVRARYPNGTASQTRWKDLNNYFKFAPQ